MLNRFLCALLMAGMIFCGAADAQTPVIIRVDLAHSQGSFGPVWAWVGHDEPNYTYGPEGRELLRELSSLSRYPVHDRAHNLLTTGDGTPALKWGSTNAFTLDASGRPVYDWTILDKIFDTYQALGIAPYVEIGFMPEALSTHPEPYQHHYPNGPLFTGWSYPPKNYQQWSELIYRWVRHSVERYGRARVAAWQWEVWNEPDIGYWHGTPAEYYKLYDYTAAAVKRALPEAKVGGPASTGPANPRAAAFLEGFLRHCASGRNSATGGMGAPLDFISFHAKGRTRMENGSVLMDIGKNLRDVDRGFAIISSFSKFRSLPVVISESDPEGCAACAAATHPQNGYRNTTQYASYEAQLLAGELALAAKYHIDLEGAVTWAFTFPGHPYFTGFRSLSTHGIDKPLMNLFRMLGLMPSERIAATSSGAESLEELLARAPSEVETVNALAAKDQNTMSVLVWNYSDSAAPGPSADVSLDLKGFPSSARRVLVERFQIDREHSNSYSAWLAMGSPQNPTAAQIAALKAAGQLKLLMSPRWSSPKNGGMTVDFNLPQQALTLFRFSW